MVKLIDMTHPLKSQQNGRKFSFERLGAEEVNPDVVRLKNQWYIMHDISIVSHIGTHIEAPYHIRRDGADLAEMPLDSLYGEAVVLDLRDIPSKSEIQVQDVQKAAEQVGGIRPGDIILCNLGYAKDYGTPAYDDAPYFSTSSLQWFVDQGMKLMGVDASGVEIPASESHENHNLLFENGIPLIENLTGFSMLDQSRFELAAFPIKAVGLESFPVRVVAFVDEC